MDRHPEEDYGKEYCFTVVYTGIKVFYTPNSNREVIYFLQKALVEHVDKDLFSKYLSASDKESEHSSYSHDYFCEVGKVIHVNLAVKNDGRVIIEKHNLGSYLRGYQ